MKNHYNFVTVVLFWKDIKNNTGSGNYTIRKSRRNIWCDIKALRRSGFRVSFKEV